ncbi:hypothetical protein RF11_14498 [Thelohanellus kitauei]|uniref:Uncharacterized protein n=1 Tax=Thelohanellus kitauei TaxID=669202 RepID=A0A0C2JAF5_THEKT|nr:hypothetical protein RF11_14498 [Thelohanellus kitauei]
MTIIGFLATEKQNVFKPAPAHYCTDFTSNAIATVYSYGRDICRLEVYKPAPALYCTDFTSTAIATVSSYGRNICRVGTLLQAVRVVLDSHSQNTHRYHQPTTARFPDQHSFAREYSSNTYKV